MADNNHEDESEEPPLEEDELIGEMEADSELDIDPSETSMDDEMTENIDEMIEERSIGSEADPSTAAFQNEAMSETEADDPGDSDETVVPTQLYCRSCEYFSDPPSVHCNHDGTTIVEFVDLERAKVRNCPIVAKRQSLVEGDVVAGSRDAVENPE